MRPRLSRSRSDLFELGLSARLGASGLVLAFGVIFATLTATASLANAKERGSELSSDLLAAGWRLFKVPGKDTAQFTQHGPAHIGVRADKAVGFLYRPLDGNMDHKRRLVWRWRVDQAVPPTDLSRAPGDDRSLAVHIVFTIDEDRLSFWESLELGFTRLVAPPMAGMVLTYVWGGTHAEGTVLANPYLSSQGRIIVLRGSDMPLGRWLSEEIDYEADFRTAFGYSPPAPIYVAISADSDDTGGRVLGGIDGLAFEG